MSDLLLQVNVDEALMSIHMDLLCERKLLLEELLDEAYGRVDRKDLNKILSAIEDVQEELKYSEYM